MKKVVFKNLFNKTKMRVLKSYLAINYAPKRFELDKNGRYLCLSPHQDDETIGLGGVLAKYNACFDVICLTNGAKGIKGTNENEAVKIRENEFNNAMDIAGVKSYKILNIEDRTLLNAYEDFSKIDFSSYDCVFVPNPIEQHKDHKAVSLHLYKYLKENPKCNFKIAFFEVWSPLSITNISIDITDVIETKKNMLNCYASQCKERSYLEASIGLSAYRGLVKEQGFAEAFLLIGKDEFLNIMAEIYPLIKD